MPTTTTYTPVEIVAFGEERPAAMPVTILTGLTLAKGTVLGRISASGKYKAYLDSNSDGSEVASGILAEAVDTSSAGLNGDFQSAMYVEGAFVESLLTGIDAAAKVDLNGRTIPGRDVFKF